MNQAKSDEASSGLPLEGESDAPESPLKPAEPASQVQDEVPKTGTKDAPGG